MTKYKDLDYNDLTFTVKYWDGDSIEIEVVYLNGEDVTDVLADRVIESLESKLEWD